MATIGERKRALRVAAKERRQAAQRAAGPRAALAMRDLFLRAFATDKLVAVSAYWPMGDELDVRPLMAALREGGATIALPVVVAPREPLIFRKFVGPASLEPGPMGTLQPAPSAEQVTPSFVVVPLLAFDRLGYRLGYGGGYYDRTLTTLRASVGLTAAVGVGFADQEVERVPTTPLDQRLTAVVTEREVIMFDEPAGDVSPARVLP